MTEFTPIQARLLQHGIVHPIFTTHHAKQSGLELASACAMLMMETSGGHNEFGHDPGNPIQGGAVTKARYEQMRAYVRDGHPSQGVGPCQLTSIGLQDEADTLGGCWHIPYNMQIGFTFLRQLQTEYGIEGGFVHYNGSGPAADAYGARSMAWRSQFLELLG